MNFELLFHIPMPVLLALGAMGALSMGMGRGAGGSAGMLAGLALAAPLVFRLWLARYAAAEMGALVSGMVVSLVLYIRSSSPR